MWTNIKNLLPRITELIGSPYRILGVTIIGYALTDSIRRWFFEGENAMSLLNQLFDTLKWVFDSPVGEFLAISFAIWMIVHSYRQDAKKKKLAQKQFLSEIKTQILPEKTTQEAIYKHFVVSRKKQLLGGCLQDFKKDRNREEQALAGVLRSNPAFTPMTIRGFTAQSKALKAIDALGIPRNRISMAVGAVEVSAYIVPDEYQDIREHEAIKRLLIANDKLEKGICGQIQSLSHKMNDLSNALERIEVLNAKP